MPSELKYAIGSLTLVVLAFLIPGGRVMVLPFFLVFVLVLIFWSARRAAEREEGES
jgi:uncharacterized membrane protein